MGEESARITKEILAQGIADVLSIKDASKIKVESFEVSAGSKVGDNFACVMLAVEAKARVDGGPERTFPFMAKVTPMNPMREKWLKEGHIFDKECLVYGELMPALEKVMAKHNIENSISIPKCHYASYDTQVILMENLKKKGYKMVDKRLGLDLEHIRMLLDQLARLHAASYHFIQTYPGGLEAMKETNYRLLFTETWMSTDNKEMKDQFDQMLTQMYGVATDIISGAKDKPELGKKAKDYASRVLEDMEAVTRPKGDFLVFNHGDCWNNNFMFLYDDNGKLLGMKVLDLQMVRYSRLSLDLAYFFCSSTDFDLREKNLGELLRHYHSALTGYLKKFGYPSSLYPYDKFQSEFDDCFTFGFITGTFISQVILNEKSYEKGGAMDFDNMTSEEEMKEMMSKYQEIMGKVAAENKDLVQRMVTLAVDAERRGII